jgi:hypothetical protein
MGNSWAEVKMGDIMSAFTVRGISCGEPSESKNNFAQTLSYANCHPKLVEGIIQQLSHSDTLKGLPSVSLENPGTTSHKRNRMQIVTLSLSKGLLSNLGTQVLKRD